MPKQNNTILWIVGIVLLIIIVGSILDKPKEDAGLKMGVILYDKYGDEISTIDSFAVVEGVTGVSFIGLTVEVQNIGDTSLGCYIEDTPSFLEAAFNENYVYLSKDEAVTLEPYTDGHTFESGLMSAEVLAGDAVDGIYTFTVWIACYDIATDGASFHESQEGSLDLSIEPDFAGFTVNVGSY